MPRKKSYSLIRVGRDHTDVSEKGFLAVLERLFWKNTYKARFALDFLEDLRKKKAKAIVEDKEESGIPDIEWKKYAEKWGGQSEWESVRNTLLSTGLIDKRDGVFYLSKRFLTDLDRVKEASLSFYT